MHATRHARGFTMIELVVVMALLGLLLSIALPEYMATLERGRDRVMQQNLVLMRDAIDKFHGDRGRYPDRLEDLVTQRYLRAIPLDPFTESPTWLVVAPRDPEQGGVIDVQRASTPEREAARPLEATTGEPGLALTDRVAREGGATQVVTVVPAAASAPAAEKQSP